MVWKLLNFSWGWVVMLLLDKEWVKGFLYGGAFAIPIIPGTLWLGEVASLILLFIFFLKGVVLDVFAKYSSLRLLLVLLLFWFFNQVITDLIVGSDYYDLMRGWMKILMLGVCLISVVCFFNTEGRRLDGFLMALLLVFFSNLFISKYIGNLEGLWKFGLARPVLYLCAMLPVFFVFGYKKMFFVFIFVGAISVAIFATRSYAMISFLVAFMVVISWLRFRKNWASNFQLLNKINITILVSGFILAAGFGAAISKQLLTFWDDRQAEKIGGQAEAELNYFLSSRPEFISAGKAISDSPLIGHGSWAKDRQYYEYMLAVLEEAGRTIKGEVDPMRIPSHSHILGSWVESGFLGGLFWVVVLFIAVKNATDIGRIVGEYRALVALCSILLIWDIVFSPYGGDRKFINAIFLAVPMVLYRRYAMRVKYES